MWRPLFFLWRSKANHPIATASLALQVLWVALYPRGLLYHADLPVDFKPSYDEFKPLWFLECHCTVFHKLRLLCCLFLSFYHGIAMFVSPKDADLNKWCSVVTERKPHALCKIVSPTDLVHFSSRFGYRENHFMHCAVFIRLFVREFVFPFFTFYILHISSLPHQAPLALTQYYSSL